MAGGDTERSILVAIDEVPSAFWTELERDYRITHVRDGNAAASLLRAHRYDVSFLDIFLHGTDGLALLRQVKESRPDASVLLTSESPSFEYARQGILYGASDFLLRPLTRSAVEEALLRIDAARDRCDTPSAALEPLKAALNTGRFPKALEARLDALGAQASSELELDRSVKELYRLLVDYAFRRYSWLGLYLSRRDCTAIRSLVTSNPAMVPDFIREKALALSGLLRRLYPEGVSPKLMPILEYMLSHVDDNLSQKELAAHFYISTPTLSGYFICPPLTSYWEYNRGMRMARAAFLLRNTDRKLYDICESLNFRDVNYFSRLFKRMYGSTVSGYRCTGFLDFQI